MNADTVLIIIIFSLLVINVSIYLGIYINHKRREKRKTIGDLYITPEKEIYLDANEEIFYQKDQDTVSFTIRRINSP